MHQVRPRTGGPVACELEAGRAYLWCACCGPRNSGARPVEVENRIHGTGDSHIGSTCHRVEYIAARSEWAWFCGCGRTGNPPHCDGSHARAAP